MLLYVVYQFNFGKTLAPPKIDRYYSLKLVSKPHKQIKAMEHLLNTSYFLTACMVTAANPFLTLMLLITANFNDSLYDILVILSTGLKSTLYVGAALSPVLIILFAISSLSKWHGI